MKTTFTWNNYWKPTPLKFRRLGDSLLAMGTVAGGYALATESKKIALGILITMVVGKFLTNFFKDDTAPGEAPAPGENTEDEIKPA